MKAVVRAAPDPALIERLQEAATRHPKAYQWRLTTLAIGGDVALTIARVLPVALPVFLGLLFIDEERFYWMGAIAILLYTGLMQLSFRLRGRELTADEAPQLFAALDELRAKLHTPGKLRVMLNSTFNAGAAEVRGFKGLLGRRCVLTLGVPLLAALSREQVMAVIAHELGHFSRRHGRLGNWLYRTRIGWIDFGKKVAQSNSAFDRMISWYANAFASYFSSRSFVHSRLCEYAADADGAFAVGSNVFADALCQAAVSARLWYEAFPRELAKLRMAVSTPPKDFYQRFCAAVREQTATVLQPWLDEALRTPPALLDTHPSLAQRLAALKEKPRLAVSSENAGEALLGDAWPAVMEEFNTKWLRKAEPEWRVEHLRVKHIARPLLNADTHRIESWDLSQRLAHAKAVRTLDRAQGLDELRALFDAGSDDPHITFAYGAALLSENDVTAAALLEKLAKSHATFRVPVHLRLASFYERRRDNKQAALHGALLELSLRRRKDAIAAFVTEAKAGRWKESSLPASAQAVLSEAVAQDCAVEGAWLMEAEVPLVTGTKGNCVPIKIHALILINSSMGLHQNRERQDAVATRYERAISSLVPPDEQAVVKAFYATEIIPAALRSRTKLL